VNFWKRLRLIGSLIVLGIAVLAVVLALRHGPDSDEDTPSARPHPALKSPSGTTGL
jgi:hypothetical protein